jgi:nascent polypeptide-associated complex subunit alpha
MHNEAQVEENEDSEECLPGLEPSEIAAKREAAERLEAAAARVSSFGKFSRSEKKSRKAVQKLGMKPFPGVVSMKVMKGKGQLLFFVNNPEVFKNPGNDNGYVIFGTANTTDQETSPQALQDQMAQFKPQAEQEVADKDIPELVPSGGQVEEVQEGDSNIADLDTLVSLVVDQSSCSRGAAVRALQETNGDVVEAIMKVTSI